MLSKFDVSDNAQICGDRSNAQGVWRTART